MAQMLLMTAHGAVDNATNSDGTLRHSVPDETGLTDRLGFHPVFCTRLFPDDLKLSWLSAWLAAPRYVDVIDAFWIDEEDVIETDAWYWSQFCMNDDSEWTDKKEKVFDVKGLPDWQKEYLVKEIPKSSLCVPLTGATLMCDVYYPKVMEALDNGTDKDVEDLRVMLLNAKSELDTISRTANFYGGYLISKSGQYSAEGLYNVWFQDSGLFVMFWSLVTRRPIPMWVVMINAQMMGYAFEDAQEIRLGFTDCGKMGQGSFQMETFEEIRSVFYKCLDNATSYIAREFFKDDYPSIGRNDPCPCGSGLKFKKCHGGNVTFDWLLEHPML